MKAAVASIIHETCSFNNSVKTTLQDFKNNHFILGAAVVDVPAHEWVIGGLLDALRPKDIEWEGIIATNGLAGAELAAGTYAELKQILLSGLRRAGRLDVVFLDLMGGMTAENEFDTEGVILEEVRKVVGPECFVAVVADHHGNITQRMVDAADLMLGHENQPHDLPHSGAKIARIACGLWDRPRNIYPALVKIPMMAPQDHFLTAAGPMKAWFDLAREIERDPEVIVASTFPTQPWLDAPNRGWSCLVYAESEEKARTGADRLGCKAWDLRQDFWRSERLGIAETVSQANAEPRGLVVISDTGDSAWGGAPGDNMSVVAEMLKQGLSGPALVPVVDPEAFKRAWEAGTGRTLTLPVGGKKSSAHSPQLAITGRVGPMTPAGPIDFGDGRIARAAPSVLFESGQLKIALLQYPDYAINHPQLYQKLGLDIGAAKMVLLKTASNFQYFRPYQSKLIRADSPGATQSDLTTLPWKNLSRPIYPLDNLEAWKPE